MTKSNIYILLGVIAVLVFLWLGGGLVGIYVLGSEDYLSKNSARILNVPYLRIGNSVIGARQWYAEYDSLRMIDPTLPADTIRSQLIDKLHEEYALRSLAHDTHVVWTRTDLNAYAEVVLQAPQRSQGQLIRKYYSGSRAGFLDHIILPLLLRDKLQRELMMQNNNESYREITDLYERIASQQASFEEIMTERAKQRHDTDDDSDEIQVILTQEDITLMGLEFIKDMQPGAITPIIPGEDGYRIYKIVNAFNDPMPAWQVQEILVPADPLGDMLASYKSKNKPYMLAYKILQPK